MFGDTVIHLIDQVRTFKGEMPGSFLKVTHAKELILVFLLMGIITDMVHQPDGDIASVVWIGLPSSRYSIRSRSAS